MRLGSSNNGSILPIIVNSNCSLFIIENSLSPISFISLNNYNMQIPNWDNIMSELWNIGADYELNKSLKKHEPLITNRIAEIRKWIMYAEITHIEESVIKLYVDFLIEFVNFQNLIANEQKGE